MRQEGSTLLVAEGNFSFASALCERLDRGTQLIATCYESEKEISKHENTTKNIAKLLEKGAEVYFQVDCTKLQEYPCLKSRQFDRIIFNFPHCGRKAGVKMNRELLANFFLSCADVLTAKGDVHVTLCKGQGGTAADQPMRAWHNSWQIVAMAARAGFILSKVQMFDCSQYDGYTSTGYRSQDKPFHVDQALTHVFTRSLPFSKIKPVVMETIIGSEHFLCHIPEELVEKINRNFLQEGSHHPVKKIDELLRKQIADTVNLQELEDSFPLLSKQYLQPDGACAESEVCQAELYWVSCSKLQEDGLRNIDYAELQYSDVPMQIFGSKRGQIVDYAILKQLGIPGSSEDCRSYCLRPTLTGYVADILQKTDFRVEVIYALSGTVFRKCLITPQTMPVFHEMILCSAFKKKADFLSLFMCSVERAISFLIKSASGTVDCIDKTLNSITFEEEGNGKSWTIHFRQTEHPEFTDLTVAKLVCIPNKQDSELNICVMSINLDLLSMVLYHINDWRMLWTFDERFLDQISATEFKPFSEFSLYPPTYSHDISFWVSENGKPEELELHALVRRVTRESVKEMKLIDSFLHTQSKRMSYCYRLMYQSCDKALSYQQALEMQLHLRVELQKHFQVTLR